MFSWPTRPLVVQKSIMKVPNQKVAKRPKSFLLSFFFSSLTAVPSEKKQYRQYFSSSWDMRSYEYWCRLCNIWVPKMRIVPANHKPLFCRMTYSHTQDTRNSSIYTEQCTIPLLFRNFKVSQGAHNHSLKNYGFQLVMPFSLFVRAHAHLKIT